MRLHQPIFSVTIACLTSILIPFCLSAQPLDDAYHNNAEIIAELQHYARQYPAWMKLDSIGFSSTDSLPIWCAKISDNPDQIEPEAALLFIGQVHAEEVVGVELVIEIMKQMLENIDDNTMRQRLEGLEIYIIPTANPEGLDVVHSGLDVTFRKNKRDNVGDGVLRIQEGEGWDTSGVDLNRNFGTHWDRGDTLYRPEDNLRYNAYRGAAPFSEPESRAIRDLALSRPFLYSIVYHSSRTGNNTEQFIAPWFWRENNIIKRPPDALAINALGERVAGMIPKMRDRDGRFRPVQSMQRKGQLQDWFYVETGCIQYMAEVSADIQPAEDSMRMVIADNLPAVWYLMDLALGLEGLDGYGTLTVIATDAETGEPIDVDVEYSSTQPVRTNPILTKRKTNSINGRFDWLLPTDRIYNKFSKFGYDTIEDAGGVPDGQRSVIELRMRRRAIYPVDFELIVNAQGDAEEAKMTIYDNNFGIVIPDLLLREANPVRRDLPGGGYSFLIMSDLTIPYAGNFTIDRDDGMIFGFNLPQASISYLENFSAVREWNHQGIGWGIVIFDGRSCLTESTVGDYPTNADMWLELNNIVRIDTARATMRIIHLPYCEPDDDYQKVEWWTNPDHISSMAWSQLRLYRRPLAGDGAEEPDWDTLYVSLDSLERGNLSVRFRTVSDDAIGEDGWLIDQVAVFVEGFVSSVEEPSLNPSTINLEPPYPNPFNSTVTISFGLGKPAPTRLGVYDLQGKMVADLLTGKIPALRAGEHMVVWDAEGLVSGIYFVRFQNDDMISTRKIVLIR